MTQLGYMLSCLVYLVTCWIASISPCWMQRRVLCVTLASTTTSLICSGTCTGYDLPCLLSAVATTSRLRISLMIYIGLMKRNHGSCSSCPLLIVPRTRLSTIIDWSWLSHVHGTVFLPTSLHQLLCRLSRDNLKLFLFTKSFRSL